MAEEIFVEKVSDDRTRVVLRVMNVQFVFVRQPKGLKLVSKSKPEAQAHDPEACWVPKSMFIAVCRKAGAILKTR